MGLDAVAIVLRAEELFQIVIDNNEAEGVRTVGDFYTLICTKLNVLPLTSPVTSATLPTITQKNKALLFLYKHTSLPAPAEILPWSPQSIWDCLVAIFVDQQALDPDEIVLNARINQDLGVD